MDMLIILLFILILPGIASWYINYCYMKYCGERSKCKKSGLEVAQHILNENNLSNIYVVETRGKLTDHYDSKRKVIRLSSDIYHNDSISSIAVAAHEVGHAIQDKEGYMFFRLRQMIFPVVSLATNFSYIVIMLGILSEALDLIYAGIFLTSFGLLFQLVTLPVEIDASKRALVELKKYDLVSLEEQSEVRTVLMAAALTYVAGVLSSIGEILRLLLIYGRRRDD